MTDKQTIVAFLACLAAIVVLVITGAIMASQGKPAEALGIGGAVTGLIGVIGTFKPRTSSPDTPQQVDVINPPNRPANVQEATP